MKRLNVVAVMLAVFVLMLGFSVISVGANVDHCPAGWVAKYEVVEGKWETPVGGSFGLSSSVGFPNGIDSIFSSTHDLTGFCAKFSTENTGILSLDNLPWRKADHDASHYVLYAEDFQEPTLTPTPDEPTSTPTPDEPTSTPTPVNPTPTPVNPTPTPVEPTPTPTETPEKKCGNRWTGRWILTYQRTSPAIDHYRTWCTLWSMDPDYRFSEDELAHKCALSCEFPNWAGELLYVRKEMRNTCSSKLKAGNHYSPGCAVGNVCDWK